MFSLQFVIEFLGTFAFAISGIRSASSKNFDWFGGYVVGLATAIGGGTIRDVMLGQVPFWMTNSIYLICTGAALLTFVMLKKLFTRLSKTWALFDTLGLALFTIAGIQKTLEAGFPFWVAIIMGCITGADEETARQRQGRIIRKPAVENKPAEVRFYRNFLKRDVSAG